MSGDIRINTCITHGDTGALQRAVFCHVMQPFRWVRPNGGLADRKGLSFKHSAGWAFQHPERHLWEVPSFWGTPCTLTRQTFLTSQMHLRDDSCFPLAFVVWIILWLCLSLLLSIVIWRLLTAEAGEKIAEVSKPSSISLTQRPWKTANHFWWKLLLLGVYCALVTGPHVSWTCVVFSLGTSAFQTLWKSAEQDCWLSLHPGKGARGIQSSPPRTERTAAKQCSE